MFCPCEGLPCLHPAITLCSAIMRHHVGCIRGAECFACICCTGQLLSLTAAACTMAPEQHANKADAAAPHLLQATPTPTGHGLRSRSLPAWTSSCVSQLGTHPKLITWITMGSQPAPHGATQVGAFALALWLQGCRLQNCCGLRNVPAGCAAASERVCRLCRVACAAHARDGQCQSLHNIAGHLCFLFCL